MYHMYIFLEELEVSRVSFNGKVKITALGMRGCSQDTDKVLIH